MVKTIGKTDVDSSKPERTERPETRSESAKPAKGASRAAKKGTMPLELKICWGTLGAAGLLALVFLLDLLVGVPFGKASIPLDVLVLLATLILAYLSWDTLRELQ